VCTIHADCRARLILRAPPGSGASPSKSMLQIPNAQRIPFCKTYARGRRHGPAAQNPNEKRENAGGVPDGDAVAGAGDAVYAVTVVRASTGGTRRRVERRARVSETSATRRASLVALNGKNHAGSGIGESRIYSQSQAHRAVRKRDQHAFVPPTASATNDSGESKECTDLQRGAGILCLRAVRGPVASPLVAPRATPPSFVLVHIW
jgi:hypothetical protein